MRRGQQRVGGGVRDIYDWLVTGGCGQATRRRRRVGGTSDGPESRRWTLSVRLHQRRAAGGGDDDQRRPRRGGRTVARRRPAHRPPRRPRPVQAADGARPRQAVHALLPRPDGDRRQDAAAAARWPSTGETGEPVVRHWITGRRRQVAQPGALTLGFAPYLVVESTSRESVASTLTP